MARKDPSLIDHLWRPQDEGAPFALNRICEAHNCQAAGFFKAPKDKSLQTHYYFCKDHAGAYNIRWNFFEAPAAQTSTYEDDEAPSGWGRQSFWDDPLDFTARYQTSSEKKQNDNAEMTYAKACRILGMETPFGLKDLTKRYHGLAMAHHPDKNKGRKTSEQIFKAIGLAYAYLKNFLKENSADL